MVICGVIAGHGLCGAHQGVHHCSFKPLWTHSWSSCWNYLEIQSSGESSYLFLLLNPTYHVLIYYYYLMLIHLFISLQVSEAGVHRPHVGGIHGRSNDGSYSLVLAGGFEDEVVRQLYR